MQDTATPTRFGAVLLAAGSASRMGHRPKALLMLDGVPLIQRQLLALAGAGLEDTVVVLGHHEALIRPALKCSQVTVVCNPSPDQGQVSSQRLGLAALPASVDAVIVALVDQPLLEAADLTALLDAWRQRPAGAAVLYPEVGGQRGNPVVFSAFVRDQILAAADDVGCRQWQAAHPDAVARYITDNRHYRTDIDTEADRARFEAATGRRLVWPDALRS